MPSLFRPRYAQLRRTNRLLATLRVPIDKPLPALVLYKRIIYTNYQEMGGAQEPQEKLINQFGTYLEKEGFSKNTIRNYLADIGKFAAWFRETRGGTLNPHNLTHTSLKGYRDYLLSSRDLSEATKKRNLATLRAFSDWAAKKSYIERAFAVKGERRGAAYPRLGLSWLWKLASAAAIILAIISVTASLKLLANPTQTSPASSVFEVPIDEEGYLVNPKGIQVDPETGRYRIIYEIKQKITEAIRSVTY